MLPLLLATAITSTTALPAIPADQCVFIVVVHDTKSKQQWGLCVNRVFTLPPKGSD